MTAFVTARFRAAMDKLAVLEGFYSNRKSDRGGETIFGISRRWFPDWPGWKIVDEARSRPGFPESLRHDPHLHEAKLALYLEEFWAPLRCNEILSSALAEELFKFGVNAGPKPAAKILQTALNALGSPLPVDGHIGPATLAATVRVGQPELLAAFRIEAARHYRAIVAEDPSQAENLAGWLNRLQEEGEQA